METTTVRVRKTTQEKLKKISSVEHISIAELIDQLVDERERSFWKGFEDEALTFLDKKERRSRKSFEGVLEDAG